MTTPFEITKEEVLNLAAQKLVDAYGGDPDLSETAERMIREKTEKMFAEKMVQRIDEFLTTEMEKLMSQEIVPVNIWGERDGKPTTIRATLAERARKFWDVKIREDGRECEYGGTARHETLMKQIVKDKFTEAVAANAELIVSEFKKAITADATKMVTDHINKLIKTKPI